MPTINNGGFFVGIVEDRKDPLKMGRCRVRIVNVHTEDRVKLPTEKLPWATLMLPAISASTNGIGLSPTGLVEGSSVLVIFNDDDQQQPIILGSFGGISARHAVGGGGVPMVKNDRDIEDGIKLKVVSNDGAEVVVNDKTASRIIPARAAVKGFSIPTGTFVSSASGDRLLLSKVPKTRLSAGAVLSFGESVENVGALKKNREANVTVDENDENDTIPVVPPRGTTPTPNESIQNIQELISACDRVGLTTKEQKCALLGIVGVESQWRLLRERFNYRPSNLRKIYKRVKEADVEKYSHARRKKITREEFFSWLYSPVTRNKKTFLGNENSEDAGKYYGRGFIQLTGKGNYRYFQNKAKEYGVDVNLLGDPDILIRDKKVSAFITALYLKDTVSPGVPSNSHPDYFYAAKKAVGKNTAANAKRKYNYYIYFYGKRPQDEREVGQLQPNKMPLFEDVPATNPVVVSRYGFRDPFGKYPLVEREGEPHTSRNSRGLYRGTSNEMKNSNRHRDIPVALNQGAWSQPTTAYNSTYPHNHVMETESGHVQEWDDTPGYERISTYHKKGTFTDILPDGSQVNVIVGDGYRIVEHNQNVHVEGACNITVNGDVNVFGRSDVNVEVADDANVQIGGNANIGVKENVNWAVDGNFSLKVAGDVVINSRNMTTTAQNQINQKSAESRTETSGDHSILAGGTRYATASKGTHVFDSSSININSGGSMDMLSSGGMRMDYSRLDLENGASGAQKSPGAVRPSQGEEGVWREETPVGDDTTEFNIPIETDELKAALHPKDRGLSINYYGEVRSETQSEWQSETGQNEAATIASSSSTGDKELSVEDERVPGTGGGSNAVGNELLPNEPSVALSDNFILNDLARDGVKRGSFEKIAYEVADVLLNLKNIAVNVLENIIDIMPGGMDGFNKEWFCVGFKSTGGESIHDTGQAIDIIIKSDTIEESMEKTFEVAAAISEKIEYDEMILVYRWPERCWLHITLKREGNKKDAYTMINNQRRENFILIEKIPGW